MLGALGGIPEVERRKTKPSSAGWGDCDPSLSSAQTGLTAATTGHAELILEKKLLFSRAVLCQGRSGALGGFWLQGLELAVNSEPTGKPAQIKAKVRLCWSNVSGSALKKEHLLLSCII